MNKLKIYSCLALLMLLFSCNDNVSFTEDDGEYPVIIKAYIDPQFTSATRGVKLTAGTLSSFGLFSFYNGTARTLNATFTIKNGNWKGDKAVTWAAGAMDFYAVSPSYKIASPPATISMKQNPKKFSYTVPTNFDDQIDIMIASSFGLTRADTNGEISLGFQPGMHYISFSGRNTIGTDYKVYVDTIIFHNIVSNGTFAYKSGYNNKGDWTPASGNDAKYVNDTIVLKSPIELTSTTKVLTGNEYLIVIPQKTTMWKTSAANPSPITVADANHNYYIETKAQIIKDEGGTQTYLLGYPDAEVDATHPKYESVYFPAVAKTFKIGAGTTLPITFNGGYNKDGEPYLENIDRGGGEAVSVEVSEWMDFVIIPEDWVPVYEELEF